MEKLYNMKTILFLFPFLSCFVFGQVENFTSNERQVQWQKVYDKTYSFDELLKEVNYSGQFYDITSTDSVITFKFKNHEIDYKGAGKPFISVTMYIESSVFSGNAIIEFKEGKYRVTLKNITYQYKPSSVRNNTNAQNIHFLEDRALNKHGNTFNSRFTKDAFMFNYSFGNLFDFKNLTKDEKW